MWAPLRTLRARFTVVTYDLRGFGESPPRTGETTHLADLLGLLDHLQLVDVTLCGNSFGGYIALHAASEQPARFRRVVALAPPIIEEPGESLLAFDRAETAAFERGDLDEAVALNLRMWCGGLAQEQRDLVATMYRRVLEQAQAEESSEEDPDPAEGWLGRITARTTVGVGTEDDPDFIRAADHVVAEVPDAELVRFEGAGHLLPLERPAEVIRLLVG